MEDFANDRLIVLYRNSCEALRGQFNHPRPPSLSLNSLQLVCDSLKASPSS